MLRNKIIYSTVKRNIQEFMIVSEGKKKIQVRLNEEFVDQVSSFQYLGIRVEETGKHESESNNSIEKTNNIYYTLNKVLMNKKEVKKQSKWKPISIELLMVLYWQVKNKSNIAGMKCLIRILGITRKDRIINVWRVYNRIYQTKTTWVVWTICKNEHTVLVKNIWEVRLQDKKWGWSKEKLQCT